MLAKQQAHTSLVWCMGCAVVGDVLCRTACNVLTSYAACPVQPNHGVPGDWVTGNRMLDVAVLPLIFAVLFPVLRSVLKKHVYQVKLHSAGWNNLALYVAAYSRATKGMADCCNTGQLTGIIAFVWAAAQLWMHSLVCNSSTPVACLSHSLQQL